MSISLTCRTATTQEAAASPSVAASAAAAAGVPGLVTAEPGAGGTGAGGSCWLPMAFLR
jgi:hypothetical protein